MQRFLLCGRLGLYLSRENKRESGLHEIGSLSQEQIIKHCLLPEWLPLVLCFAY